MREIGGYELIRQIGFGGMSTVYEAVNGAGDHVALKLLHPSLAADETARLRLQREVAVLRRVRSPYVAEVIDAEFDALEPFIVTELVPGLSLEADVQENGIYTEEDLVRLGEQLGEALRAVHSMGVLHRDLKPSNVMISLGGGDTVEGAAGELGAASKPVLIDFGIAQAQEDSRLTQAGALALTPGYCDPRVLAGADPDVLADWWALAAVLAYAATGEAPFGEGSAPVVIERVMHGEPRFPGLDPVIGQAFAAALMRDPAARISYGQLLGVIRQPATWIAPRPEQWQSSAGLAPNSELPGPNLEVLALTAPEQLPDWVRLAKKCRLLLSVIWLALAGIGARWPAWVIVAVAVAVYVLDIVGSLMRTVRSRQLRRGEPRAGDGAVAAVRFPFTALGAMLRTCVTVAVVGLLAFGLAWLSTRATIGAGEAAPDRQAMWASGIAAASAAAIWFSPFSKRAREGVRYVTGGAAASRTPRVVWLLAALALLVVALVLANGAGAAGTSWEPFSQFP